MKPTHQCKVCGALWRLWKPGEVAPNSPAFWSLVSLSCGLCCDNVLLDDQIERLFPDTDE